MRPADSALPQLAALRQCHSKALHACSAVPAHQDCSAINRSLQAWRSLRTRLKAAEPGAGANSPERLHILGRRSFPVEA
ncbi:MAG: hypothetical protein LBU32_14185 [Clostridiales bacterium]|nr:hypothetical protein [Clostridiales bacterium]